MTEVENLEFAAVVGPICWKPVTVKTGNVDANEFEGTPGTTMPGLSEELFAELCNEDWSTERRVYPKRAWFNADGERL